MKSWFIYSNIFTWSLIKWAASLHSRFTFSFHVIFFLFVSHCVRKVDFVICRKFKLIIDYLGAKITVYSFGILIILFSSSYSNHIKYTVRIREFFIVITMFVLRLLFITLFSCNSCSFSISIDIQVLLWTVSKTFPVFRNWPLMYSLRTVNVAYFLLFLSNSIKRIRKNLLSWIYSRWRCQKIYSFVKGLWWIVIVMVVFLGRKIQI
jgi:hypothetical protein